MAICPYCKKEFDLVDGLGDYCSHRCLRRATNKRIWSGREIEYLKSLVGLNPVPKIVADWNEIAKEKGWMERSPSAIRLKIYQSFTTAKAVKDNLSFARWAKKLNVPVDRLQIWESLGLKVGNYALDAGKRAHIKCVSRQALTEFARVHPEQLWGIAKNILEECLTDQSLARALFKTVNQPTVGRTIAVVDLKHCKVYSSARNAATVLSIHKETILYNVKANSSSQKFGYNFAQIDYPVWWITREHAPIMHEIAGEVLYELHAEYTEVEGFSKQRFLSLGVAIAVRIAIRSLKLYHQEYKSVPDTKDGALSEIAKRVRSINDSFQQRFINKPNNQCFEIIKSTIKNKTQHIFYRRVSDKRKLDLYLEEFANGYIEFAVKFFKRSQYLPKNWQPKTAIEYAFYWDSIFSTIFMKREVGRTTEEPKMMLVRVLAAYSFIQKRGLEFSGVEHNENYLNHQQQSESNESLFESELAEFIEKQSQNKYLQSILFALAHGFSDQEIAMQLELSKGRYYEYKEELQGLTKEFMQQAEVF